MEMVGETARFQIQLLQGSRSGIEFQESFKVYRGAVQRIWRDDIGGAQKAIGGAGNVTARGLRWKPRKKAAAALVKALKKPRSQKEESARLEEWMAMAAPRWEPERKFSGEPKKPKRKPKRDDDQEGDQLLDTVMGG